MEYFSKGESQCVLPNGEIYAYKHYDEIPSFLNKLPLLIPATEKWKKSQWLVFGVMPEGEGDGAFPKEPLDEFAIS
jgi:hypothetical protein